MRIRVLPEQGTNPLKPLNFRFSGKPTPQMGVEVERKWRRDDYHMPGTKNLFKSNCRTKKAGQFMAVAVDIRDFTPVDSREDLIRRVEQAPVEHAEAVLAAYDLLQRMHEKGLLDLLNGLLSAGDTVIIMWWMSSVPKRW